MILLSSEFTQRLLGALEKGLHSYIIACAFIKLEALRKLSENFSGSVGSITIISRWQKHDLVAGASDLQVYEYCRSQGWRFGIDQSLHGKLYLIDKSTVLLGSANLTRRGLSFDGVGNNEFGTQLEIGEVDNKKIEAFISESVTWMNDELYGLMVQEVSDSKVDQKPISDVAWPNSIAKRVGKPTQYLWINELLFNSPEDLLRLDLNDSTVIHDFELLGLDFDEITDGALRRAFRRSKLYSWLINCIERHDSVSFGLLSKELHNAILNDPTPYRREVKDFVRIIFTWSEFMNEDFKITSFARTSAIELVKAN